MSVYMIVMIMHFLLFSLFSSLKECFSSFLACLFVCFYLVAQPVGTASPVRMAKPTLVKPKTPVVQAASRRSAPEATIP